MSKSSVKRKADEDIDNLIITSIPTSKKRIEIINTIENNALQKKISPIRKDSIRRRVSTSANQTTLDLEEELFSPAVKLADSIFMRNKLKIAKRKSLRKCQQTPSDSDTSCSNISIPQDVSRSRPSVKEKPSTNESLTLDEESTEFVITSKPTPITQIETIPVISCLDDSLICQEEPEEELDDESYSMLIIKTLPDYATILPTLKHTNLLPEKEENAPKYTLILDLDETLVHCVMEPIEVYDQTFDISYNNETITVYALFRPYLQEFLKEMSSLYEIVVFTASQDCYADALLDIVDPNKYVKYRLYRQHCLFVEENYIKDMNSLNRDLKKTVIMDNAAYAFGYHLDNGIPIPSWFDNKNDTELKDIIPLLKELTQVEDVRPVLQNKYHLRQRVATFSFPVS